MTGALLRLGKYHKENPNAARMVSDLHAAKSAASGGHPGHGHSATNTDAASHRTASRQNAGLDRDFEASSEAEFDPTWVPNERAAPARKIRHRYTSSKRNRRTRVIPDDPEMREPLPGEFELDISNLDNEGNSSDARSLDTAAATASHNDSTATTAKKRLGHSFSNFRKTSYGNGYAEAAHQVLLAWETFLVMTTSASSQVDSYDAKSGSRSLFSTALSSASSWICAEQKAIDTSDDKDDTTNVADEIFTGLEEMYSYGNGWKPLREFVYRHGVRLLCNAIRQRILAPTTVRWLEIKATELMARYAADEIIFASCDVAPRIDPPVSIDTHLVPSPPINILFARLAADNARHSLTWRCLSGMLRRSTLPAEWVCTMALKDVIISALKSVFRETQHTQAAVDLITQVLQSSIDPRDEYGNPASSAKVMVQVTCAGRFYLRHSGKTSRADAGAPNQEAESDDDITNSLNNSIASILKILGTAHVKNLRQSSTVRSKAFPESRMQHILAGIISNYQQYSIGRKQQLPKTHLLRLLYVFLTYHIYMADEQPAQVSRPCTTPLKPTAPRTTGSFHLEFLENFLQPLSQRTKLIKALSSFILNISCDRGVNIETGFAHIKRVTKSFLHVNNHRYPTVHAFLGRIAVDTALDFAAATLIPGHHEWALSIQGEVQGRGASNVVLTPSLALAGYKWEDGLGEWVEKTPLSAAARAVMLKNARAFQAASENAEIAGSKCHLPSPNDSAEGSSDESDGDSSAESEGEDGEEEREIDDDGDVEMAEDSRDGQDEDATSSESDLDVTPLPQRHVKLNRWIPAPSSVLSSRKRRRLQDISPSKGGHEQRDSENFVGSNLFPSSRSNKPRRASSLLARQKWHVYIDENPGDDSSDSFEDPASNNGPTPKKKRGKSAGKNKRSVNDSRVLKEKECAPSNRPTEHTVKPSIIPKRKKSVGAVAFAAGRRSSVRLRRSRLSTSTPANIEDEKDELSEDRTLAHEDKNHERGYRSHVSDSDNSESEDDILANAPTNYSTGGRRRNARRSIPSSSCNNGLAVNIVINPNRYPHPTAKPSRASSSALPSDAAVDLAGMSEDELSFV